MGCDARVIRYDERDHVLWSRGWGGPGFDVAHDVHRLGDGGLLIAGYGFAGSRTGNDAFLLKLSPSGVVEWSRRYGGPGDDRAVHAAVLPDSDFALVGTSRDPAGGVDCVVRETTPGGELRWEQYRIFAGEPDSYRDGGYRPVVGLPAAKVPREIFRASSKPAGAAQSMGAAQRSSSYRLLKRTPAPPTPAP